ncbi:hypothetical protein FRC18_003190 [Serendipita sp. 400]|nr:hypothetical protein FRC18_003190 [Serendipita sp. 400]
MLSRKKTHICTIKIVKVLPNEPSNIPMSLSFKQKQYQQPRSSNAKTVSLDLDDIVSKTSLLSIEDPIHAANYAILVQYFPSYATLAQSWAREERRTVTAVDK